ncbi:DUF2797 domain-containing protein [Methylophaga sp. OBS4]|uniref:DUF2797 domain-containing protein n=1 Tax=Methylophaga sp. OBS4 TaxID=2991935 RepID=UPI002254A456|nr:DUF2797 domain-containing protein [Methylophaga sp. OBS4]MCX4188490.1 DUF2797 domain-containing protein [Methylophaga sp. OBS4]
MAVTLPSSHEAQYEMRLGDERVAMNALIGQSISLNFLGEIHCLNCQRLTKKSYSGGFCFPCSQKLAQCDLCFMKPELCHYAAGTCREPEWGEAVCMQEHIVYLANSSGLKVGITRINQIPTRWIDQGATQAIPIFRVKTRYQSGLVEVMFKSHVSDRTDWRKMLKGDAEPLDLAAERDRLLAECVDDIKVLQQQFGDDAIKVLLAEPVVTISYPVNDYPGKVSSLNFDKTAEIRGQLQGIKGQYLILDNGVLNIRKFSGYQIEMVV